jgi:hypothetical protein
VGATGGASSRCRPRTALQRPLAFPCSIARRPSSPGTSIGKEVRRQRGASRARDAQAAEEGTRSRAQRAGRATSLGGDLALDWLRGGAVRIVSPVATEAGGGPGAMGTSASVPSRHPSDTAVTTRCSLGQSGRWGRRRYAAPRANNAPETPLSFGPRLGSSRPPFPLRPPIRPFPRSASSRLLLRSLTKSIEFSVVVVERTSFGDTSPRSLKQQLLSLWFPPPRLRGQRGMSGEGTRGARSPSTVVPPLSPISHRQTVEERRPAIRARRSRHLFATIHPPAGDDQKHANASPPSSSTGVENSLPTDHPQGESSLVLLIMNDLGDRPWRFPPALFFTVVRRNPRRCSQTSRLRVARTIPEWDGSAIPTSTGCETRFPVAIRRSPLRLLGDSPIDRSAHSRPAAADLPALPFP